MFMFLVFILHSRSESLGNLGVDKWSIVGRIEIMLNILNVPVNDSSFQLYF